MNTNELAMQAIRTASDETRRDMLFLGYNPYLRFSNNAWKDEATERQVIYFRSLSMNDPVLHARITRMLTALWGETWTKADASFGINRMKSPDPHDWLGDCMDAIVRDLLFRLCVGGASECQTKAMQIAHMLRGIATDLEHIGYHVLDQKDMHGRPIEECAKLMTELDGNAVSDSIAPEVA